MKPGVMIYFDIAPALKKLSDEECGRLFRAVLDYAQTGALPELDGMLSICFDFIRPTLDRDSERYERVQLSRKYSAYCSHTDNPLPYEKWLDRERLRTQPTATSASTSAPIRITFTN